MKDFTGLYPSVAKEKGELKTVVPMKNTAHGVNAGWATVRERWVPAFRRSAGCG
jgi:hypothetical protein